MKKYQSHKVVEAAKIVDVLPDGARIRLDLGGAEWAAVAAEWVERHAPDKTPFSLIGGYLVQYPGDLYVSWSPAAAFEEGYTAVVHDPKDGALPVAGYKAQTPETVRTVNLNKQAEEATLQILDALESYPGIDSRWLADGRRYIERGWMFVNRAVFKPGRVKLAGDDQREMHERAVAMEKRDGSPDAWRG